MYTINLSDVIYPSNIDETVAKEVRQERTRLCTMKPEQGRAVSWADAEKMIEMRKFEPIDETLSTISTAIDSYFALKYLVPEKGVIVPAPMRNQAARLILKLTQHDDGFVDDVEPSDIDFLLTVFDADLPYINTFVYVADYLRKLKFEADAAAQEAKAAKAAAKKFDPIESMTAADAAEPKSESDKIKRAK